MESVKKAGMPLLCAVCYGVCIAFSLTGQYLLSGLVLMTAAVGMYGHYYIRSGNLLDFGALYSLFWVGGQAVACLKLSNLSTQWTAATWLCLFLSCFCFLLGYEPGVGERLIKPGKKLWKRDGGKRVPSDEALLKRLKRAMEFLLAVSLLCFLFEAAVLKFIPLFSPEPHAYSYFHISGVHYFTVSCVLVPPLSILYWQEKKRRRKEGLTRAEALELCIVDALAFAIPVLCVSRFQLMLSAALCVLVYLQFHKRMKLTWLLAIVLGLVCAYVLLTFARRHDVTYLNGIFDMKNPDMPIFITQPYMYIANNFDNFNCLVRELAAHTWGLRQLFPIIALTGLKFLKPELAAFPIYVTKEELTTVSLIYDAYYDFGIIGVALFAFLLGFACRMLLNFVRDKRNPIGMLFYGQMAMYLILSFFTTWFSNPTTWFWFAVTAALFWYVGRTDKKIETADKKTEIAGGKKDASL